MDDESNDDTTLVVDKIDGPLQLSSPIIDNEVLTSGVEEENVLGEFENIVTSDMMSISGHIWHEKNGNGFEDTNKPG